MAKSAAYLELSLPTIFGILLNGAPLQQLLTTQMVQPRLKSPCAGHAKHLKMSSSTQIFYGLLSMWIPPHKCSEIALRCHLGLLRPALLGSCRLRGKWPAHRLPVTQGSRSRSRPLAQHPLRMSKPQTQPDGTGSNFMS